MAVLEMEQEQEVTLDDALQKMQNMSLKELIVWAIHVQEEIDATKDMCSQCHETEDYDFVDLEEEFSFSNCDDEDCFLNNQEHVRFGYQLLEVLAEKIENIGGAKWAWPAPLYAPLLPKEVWETVE